MICTKPILCPDPPCEVTGECPIGNMFIGCIQGDKLNSVDILNRAQHLIKKVNPSPVKETRTIYHLDFENALPKEVPYILKFHTNRGSFKVDVDTIKP